MSFLAKNVTLWLLILCADRLFKPDDILLVTV